MNDEMKAGITVHSLFNNLKFNVDKFNIKLCYKVVTIWPAKAARAESPSTGIRRSLPTIWEFNFQLSGVCGNCKKGFF